MKILTQKKLVYISIPAILLIAGLFVFWLVWDKVDYKVPNELNHEKISSFEIKIEVTPNFYRLLQSVEKQSSFTESGAIQGGIIPHHELASEMIADFFYRLSKKNSQLETFIILGPNHDDLAEQIISAPVDWSLINNEIKFDDKVYRNLLDRKIIANNFQVLKNEHSVKVPVPYIAHYFPNAKIVPIIFTSGLTEQQIDQFASALVENIDETTIVLGSLDFSHYLPSVQTANKDAVTLAAIEQRNYQAITNFGNDNIDSAVTLSAFLKTMDLIKANSLEVRQHYNSADFIGHEINSSTSYFTLFFY